MAQTKVILCEKINGLGAEADVVKVKAGYARNFLIPYGKAYEATEANLTHMEGLRATRAKREAEELEISKKLSTAISKLRPTFKLETGETGKAFGSVTSMDIHKKLEDEGIEIDRHAILLKNPIKAGGSKDIEIKLHAEVSATLTIRVDADAPKAAAKPERASAE